MKLPLTLGLAALAVLITLAFTPNDATRKAGGNDEAATTDIVVPLEKVHICHRTGRISDGTVENPQGKAIPEGETVGRIIVVAEKSVPMHCAHGDKVITGDTPHDLGNCRVDKDRQSGCDSYE